VSLPCRYTPCVNPFLKSTHDEGSAKTPRTELGVAKPSACQANGFPWANAVKQVFVRHDLSRRSHPFQQWPSLRENRNDKNLLGLLSADGDFTASEINMFSAQVCQFGLSEPQK